MFIYTYMLYVYLSNIYIYIMYMNIYIYIYIAPPDCFGGYVCQFWAWGARLPANGYISVSIDSLNQKYIKGGTLPVWGATEFWQTSLFKNI